MNYNEALIKITTDERFASFQNYDPELNNTIDWFSDLPDDVIRYCFDTGADFDETEPYFEEVVSYIKSRLE